MRSEVWTLWTPSFQPCHTHKLTRYSTGMNKVIGKPVDLPQWFFLFYYEKYIDKHLLFCCLPLTKILICLQCDSILCLKLFWVLKSNMMTVEITKILIIGFYLIKNHNYYHCLIIFLFRIESIKNIFFMLGLMIKSYENKS